MGALPATGAFRNKDITLPLFYDLMKGGGIKQVYTSSHFFSNVFFKRKKKKKGKRDPCFCFCHSITSFLHIRNSIFKSNQINVLVLSRVNLLCSG
jgi:hypothetical protein